MAQRININYATCRVWPLHKGHQKGVQTNATRRDIINIHNPLHQFTIFACGGAPSKTTHFSPWPPPSNVTSQSASRARGCVRGIWGERWLRDEGRGWQISESLFEDSQATAEDEAENSTRSRKFFFLVFYWSNRTVWPRHLSFTAPLASSTDGVKSKLTRCELSVRLTVKLLTDETRIITASERKYAYTL